MAGRGTRKVVKYQGMKVRLKRGQASLSSQQKNAIHRMESERGGRKPLSTAAGCTIVFFRSKAVQRCDNRKLSTSAKSRYRSQVRRKEICRKKTRKSKGKQKLFTNRC